MDPIQKSLDILSSVIPNINDLYRPHKYELPKTNLESVIDFTFLSPSAGIEEWDSFFEKAAKKDYFSICIPPSMLNLAAKKVPHTKRCTVVSFPFGQTSTEQKVQEAKWSIKNGAEEIDFVINPYMMKSKNYRAIISECEQMRALCAQTPIKIILETSQLSTQDIVVACLIAKYSKLDFVKTSTGFSNQGAVIEHVQLMRKVVGKEMGVKASGGIRDKKLALAFLEAGANRIGTSQNL